LLGRLGNPAGESADAPLLDRFVADQDASAFAALVRRHGPLVLGVCRRVLRDAHDAEDAFQATFFVLAKKARALDRSRPLSGWLYTVAHNTALKARTSAARRRARERQVANMMAQQSQAHPVAQDTGGVIDAELAQLPEKYRLPLILCYLEGRTNESAARELGWPVGSMAKRLERGRELLRQRLTRRGLALSALSALAAQQANVSAAQVDTISRAAVRFAAGQAATAPWLQTAALAGQTLHGMFVSQCKLAAVLVLAVGLVGTGLGLAGYRLAGAGLQASAPAPEAEPTPARPAEDPKDRALREKLAKVINLEKGIAPNTPLKDALEFLASQYDFKFAIDAKAFAADGAPKVEEHPVLLPKMMGVSLGTVLSLLSLQVVGDQTVGCWHVRAGTVVVTTDVLLFGPFFDSPAAPGLKKVLDKPITLDMGFGANTTLNEALEFLCDKFDVTIIIDARSFAATGVEKVEEMPVQLPAQKNVKLGDVLRLLVAQVKGDTFEGGIIACRDFVAVVPQHMQLAKKEPLTADQLDELWESLNGAQATALVARTLIALPQQTVPWLRERLRPVKVPAKLDAALVAQRLTELESNTFAVRQKAEEELEKFGPPVLPALRECLEKKKPLEVTRRLEDLIKRLDQPSDELRALRALRVLEMIDTAEARQLIDTLAQGAADARLTREAKAALRRLDK
jgi:RNA polymerase sigma factor (sigma-70 family)